jgi:hypothetical protein
VALLIAVGRAVAEEDAAHDLSAFLADPIIV